MNNIQLLSKDMLSLAAEMMRKGGTLLAEPCKECKGVQVKFKDRIVCVNCKRETKLVEEEKVEAHDLYSVITQKINELTIVLMNEKEISRQLEISKLINNYLDILAKIKKD